jgi:hypothetical protein
VKSPISTLWCGKGGTLEVVLSRKINATAIGPIAALASAVIGAQLTKTFTVVTSALGKAHGQA